MELELKWIHADADVYDVRKAVAAVLHGPDFYDPNDRDHKGRVPNFLIVMGESPAGHSHNGKAFLRVGFRLGERLLKWNRESEENSIVVKGRRLKIFRTYDDVPPDVKQTLEKVLYIDPERDKLRSQIEEQSKLVRLRIARVQFGVWYKSSDPDGKRRRFSVEHEREFLSNSAAYIDLQYERKLIRIDVRATLLAQSRSHLTSPHPQIGQRETEEIKYSILVKFSSIHKLEYGPRQNEDEPPCEYTWHLYQHFA